MVKQIASIHFETKIAKRDAYAGNFMLPAVPKGGEPAVIAIPDHVQREQGTYTEGRQLRRYTVRGEEIARDILAEWTEQAIGMTPHCHPGIWIVRDVVPVLLDNGQPEISAERESVVRLANDAERAQMWNEDLQAARTADANWAEYLIERGDILARKIEERVLITPSMRAAAIHYGRERDWLHALKDTDVQACPYCTTMVPVHAVVCPKCTQVVNPDAWARLELLKSAAKSALPKPNQFQPVNRDAAKTAPAAA
jgi:hypothetical protein